MYLPGRPEIKNSRSMLRAFGGLNETYGCTEAEFSQALNFSSRDFPALSTRLPRRKLRAAENVRGMYQLGGLLMLCGTTLHYTPDDAGEEPVTLENAVSDTEKALVGIGTKILIFPDQLAFDTADGSLTALGARWSGEETALELTPCDADGKTYTVDRWGLEEPEDPADGEIFLKAANVNTPWRHDGVLEVYSQADEKWNAVTLDHCLLSGEGLSEAFRQWDTVTVSGTAAILAGMGADLDGEQVLYNVEEGVLRVLLLDGDYFCDTLEDAVRDTKIPGRTAIPAGRYRVIVNQSPRFGRDLPRLLDVPRFEGILIHRGNTAKDTAGCILVGENKEPGKVVNSGRYEEELTRILKEAQANGEEIRIEIE